MVGVFGYESMLTKISISEFIELKAIRQTSLRANSVAVADWTFLAFSGYGVSNPPSCALEYMLSMIEFLEFL